MQSQGSQPHIARHMWLGERQKPQAWLSRAAPTSPQSALQAALFVRRQRQCQQPRLQKHSRDTSGQRRAIPPRLVPWCHVGRDRPTCRQHLVTLAHTADTGDCRGVDVILPQKYLHTAATALPWSSRARWSRSSFWIGCVAARSPFTVWFSRCRNTVNRTGLSLPGHMEAQMAKK